MSTQRLGSRVTSALKLGTATLFGHDLRFHKVSNKDGSGKCDIYETNEPEHFVIGVVYKIDPTEKPILDRFEGLGYGYDEKLVSVEMSDGVISAFTYYATNIEPELNPFHWYKEHVIRGARENELPAEYIQKLKQLKQLQMTILIAILEKWRYMSDTMLKL